MDDFHKTIAYVKYEFCMELLKEHFVLYTLHLYEHLDKLFAIEHNSFYQSLPEPEKTAWTQYRVLLERLQELEQHKNSVRSKKSFSNLQYCLGQIFTQELQGKLERAEGILNFPTDYPNIREERIIQLTRFFNAWRLEHDCKERIKETIAAHLSKHPIDYVALVELISFLKSVYFNVYSGLRTKPVQRKPYIRKFIKLLDEISAGFNHAHKLADYNKLVAAGEFLAELLKQYFTPSANFQKLQDALDTASKSYHGFRKHWVASYEEDPMLQWMAQLISHGTDLLEAQKQCDEEILQTNIETLLERKPNVSEQLAEHRNDDNRP